MPDSATGGYLLPNPSPPPPLEDDALDDFIQGFVVGITGLAGALVRPRWQVEPPNLPDETVSWAAVGIIRREGDTYSAEQHIPDGNGSTNLIRHETLDVLATFYGPNAQANGALLRDGLGLAQNREQLFLNGMGLVSIGQLMKGPELIKSKWYPKADLPLAIRRVILRNYPILNLESAGITLETEAVTTPITVPRP